LTPQPDGGLLDELVVAVGEWGHGTGAARAAEGIDWIIQRCQTWRKLSTAMKLRWRRSPVAKLTGLRTNGWWEEPLSREADIQTDVDGGRWAT
jgi:hypothetical protein